MMLSNMTKLYRFFKITYDESMLKSYEKYFCHLCVCVCVREIERFTDEVESWIISITYNQNVQTFTLFNNLKFMKTNYSYKCIMFKQFYYQCIKLHTAYTQRNSQNTTDLLKISLNIYCYFKP